MYFSMLCCYASSKKKKKGIEKRRLEKQAANIYIDAVGYIK